MEHVKNILNGNLSDIEKLTQIYEHFTSTFIEYAQRDVELARAANDPMAIVQEQIKLETIKFARANFRQCYTLVAGKRDWND